MKKLNLLYVDFSVGFGGSAISLKNLTQGISALGYNVVVAFVFQKKGALDSKHLFPGNIKVVYLADTVTAAFLRISRCLYDNEFLVRTKITFFLMFFIKIFMERIPTVLKLVFLIKAEKINVVHVNNGISVPIILSAHLARVPCVVSLRSFVNKELASRRILKQAHCFVANSQAVKNDFILKSGLGAQKVRVIYNRIDMDQIESRGVSSGGFPLDRHFGQKIIGTAGRLIEWKRQDLLILATEELLRRGLDVKCVIVGTSEEAVESRNYENKLKDMVRARNLDGHVVFTGFLENPSSFMRKFDVFVLPSILEPFGNVVLEAMSLGVPVVAFNGGGPAEIITHDHDGMLVPVGDTAALTDTLSRLLNDNDLHKMLSLNAIQKVKNEFLLEKSIREWDELYKESAQHQDLK
jgi:glycosyltransferase involved in cell wall biosynthesis